jgi:putative DNA primase/helicase
MPVEGANIARLDEERRRRNGGGSGSGSSPNRALVLDPKAPLETAAAFLRARHVDELERQLLLCQGAVFYRYDGLAYRPIEEDRLAAEIYDYTKLASQTDKNDADPFNPDRRKVGDILHALKALTHLPGEIAPPAWLTDAPGDTEGEDLLACRDTLLHLPSMSRVPHSPDFFNLNALDFDYDPNATCPLWLRFLEQVLPDDIEARAQLRRMFGYLLTPDTRQQKAFLLIGLPRSGKGTIGRVLAKLIGERNMVAPALSSLATTFGREQLLAKRLALISDARLSARTDQGPIVESILSITGEDSITIQRKFLPSWSGRLPLRFVMLSNELPAFIDAAGAFVSRWIIFQFPISFLGREDPGLTDALLEELPGILNWALEGLAELRVADRFVQPTASAQMLQRWQDLSSPIGAFLRTQCVIAPGSEVERDILFEAWRKWRESEGYAGPTTRATFGKTLISKVVGLADARAPRQYDLMGNLKPRPWLYRGVRLKTAAEMEAQE